MPILLILSSIVAFGIVSCSSTNSAIKAMRAEKIIDFTPTGLEDKGITDMPAGPIDQQNWIVRTFIAADDKTLLRACSEAYERALDDGWSGPEPSDPGGSGITATTMTKGEMELDISCATTASFDQFDHDDDRIRLSVRIGEG